MRRETLFLRRNARSHQKIQMSQFCDELEWLIDNKDDIGILIENVMMIGNTYSIAAIFYLWIDKIE